MGLFAFNPQSSLLHRPPLSTPSGLAAHCGVAARPRLRLIPTVAHAGMPPGLPVSSTSHHALGSAHLRASGNSKWWRNTP